MGYRKFTELKNDPSPELGGDLVVNGHSIKDTGSNNSLDLASGFGDKNVVVGLDSDDGSTTFNIKNQSGSTVASMNSDGDVISQGFLNIGSKQEHVLSSNTNGEITVSNSRVVVDTYDGQAAGDLSTINGGLNGCLIFITAKSDSRTIVLKDGVGNLSLESDLTLDHTHDTVFLERIGGIWYQFSFANNS